MQDPTVEPTVEPGDETEVPEETGLEVAAESFDLESEGTGKLSEFLTDPNAEINGVWFEDMTSGVNLQIAHGENRRYRDFLQQLLRPFIQLIQSNTPRGYAALRRFEAQAMAKFVLLGWEGLKDDQGVEIPYSEEKAFEMLFKPEYRPFRRLVDVFCSDDSAFGPSREALGKG